MEGLFQDSFYRSARLLLRAVLDGKILEAEGIAAVFLCRHYLELALKYALFHSRWLKDKDTNALNAEILAVGHGHDLKKIWDTRNAELTKKLSSIRKSITGAANFQSGSLSVPSRFGARSTGTASATRAGSWAFAGSAVGTDRALTAPGTPGVCLQGKLRIRNAVGFSEPGGPNTARYGANGSFSANQLLNRKAVNAAALEEGPGRVFARLGPRKSAANRTGKRCRSWPLDADANTIHVIRVSVDSSGPAHRN